MRPNSRCKSVCNYLAPTAGVGSHHAALQRTFRDSSLGSQNMFTSCAPPREFDALPVLCAGNFARTKKNIETGFGETGGIYLGHYNCK